MTDIEIKVAHILHGPFQKAFDGLIKYMQCVSEFDGTMQKSYNSVIGTLEQIQGVLKRDANAKDLQGDLSILSRDLTTLVKITGKRATGNWEKERGFAKVEKEFRRVLADADEIAKS